MVVWDSYIWFIVTQGSSGFSALVATHRGRFSSVVYRAVRRDVCERVISSLGVLLGLRA